MKTTRSSVGETQADPKVVDEIVEDLSQQDVLPSDTGSEELGDDLEEASAQAGRWDDPVGGQGHQAGRTPLEDETKSSEILVERGVTEAADELEELEESETLPEETE